jgi:predicted enzyme related to lactoylglutathione lyase
MKPSNFIWYELMTSDVDAAAKFYGAIVGWTAQDSGTPGMDYRQWAMGGVPVGGLLAIPEDAAAHGMRPAWLGYLHVEDADASVAGVTAAGGAAPMPPTDIPGVGRIAMVTDPQGAAFYVMTPLPRMTTPGSDVSQAFASGQPGHGGWNELHTTDWEAALAFYTAQFGFGKSGEFNMGPMGTYLLFNTGGEAVGGMMNNPNVPRPAWLYYFNVEDIDTAKSRVEAAGGTVINGPHQVPTGNWIIQARDPEGVMFALVGPHVA